MYVIQTYCVMQSITDSKTIKSGMFCTSVSGQPIRTALKYARSEQSSCYEYARLVIILYEKAIIPYWF